MYVCMYVRMYAPLINLSIVQHLTNCAIFGQSRSTLTIWSGLGLRGRARARIRVRVSFRVYMVRL